MHLESSGAPSLPGSRGLRMPSQGALLGAVIVLATLAGLGYLVTSRLSPAPSGTEMVTAPVSRQDLVASVNATGTVVSTATSRLAFKATGRIAEITVNVGDQVRAGQIVARQDTADLDAAVLQAEANLLAGEAKLASMLQGPKREDVIAAEASLEAARARLVAMQLGTREEELAAVQSSVDSAQAKLQLLLAGPRSEDVVAAQASVDSARGSLESARAKLDQVKAGPTEAERIAAEAALSAAHASRAAAQARISAGHDEDSPPWDRISNTAALASADAQLRAAEAKLLEFRQGPRAADVVAAETAVTSAEASLRSAEAKLSQLLAGPDDSEIVAARASLAQANSNLALKLTPYMSADFLAQEQALRQAEANLLAKRKPYEDSEILAARASVVQAQANRATAQANVSGATLIAPFDGIVSAIAMSVGETAVTTGNNPSSITVVDPPQLRVDIQVDEADIARVSVGQAARVTFDALPGRAIEGRVTAVAPSGTLNQGVVGYPVSISVQNARGVRPGMTAVAEVEYERRNNALVVPNRAVIRQGRERFVQVQAPTGLERKRVQTGMANDEMTEITEGLAEGEAVVIPQTTARPSVPGAGGLRGPGGFSGGPPGGGTFIAPAP